MRLSFVADIHGNFAELERVARRSERLVILGDLLDYVDYHDPSAGILGEMFGVDRVRLFTRMRAAGDFAALHRLNSELWDSIDDAEAVLSGMIRERYRTVVEIVGPDALVTLGNVDVAAEWDRAVGDLVPYRDAQTVEVDGVRLGFVAGGAHRGPPRVTSTADRRPWRPFVRSASDYRAAVAALDEVDVLCTHLPPDVAVLRYDTVPARLEMAGPGLDDYICRARPSFALFGHVHQPLATRTRLGHTECLNVGHFRRHPYPVTLDTDRIRAARRQAVPSEPGAGR